jgi:hypothetical protein
MAAIRCARLVLAVGRDATPNLAVRCPRRWLQGVARRRRPGIADPVARVSPCRVAQSGFAGCTCAAVPSPCQVSACKPRAVRGGAGNRGWLAVGASRRDPRKHGCIAISTVVLPGNYYWVGVANLMEPATRHSDSPATSSGSPSPGDLPRRRSPPTDLLHRQLRLWRPPALRLPRHP